MFWRRDPDRVVGFSILIIKGRMGWNDRLTIVLLFLTGIDSAAFGADPTLPFSELVKPASVTVRVGELPYKRLYPTTNTTALVQIETASIMWETIEVRDAIVLSPRIGESGSTKILSIIAETSSTTRPVVGILPNSDLSCEQYRDLGWTVSYIAGSHLAGRPWYHSAISAADAVISAGKASPQLSKVLYSMRAKLYGVGDWDGLEQLCQVALKIQSKGTIDEFWWRLFHVLSFSGRNTSASVRQAASMVQVLADDAKKYPLGAKDRTELDWTRGLILYNADMWSLAILPLKETATATGFAHREDAWVLLIAATAKTGAIQNADAMLDDYIREFRPSREQVASLMRLTGGLHATSSGSSP